MQPYELRGLQPQSPGVKLQGLHTAILILTKLPGFRLRGCRFVEAFQHEIHQGIPTVKAQVAGQGFDVVEQSLARGQLLAQQLEFAVRPVQHRVD